MPFEIPRGQSSTLPRVKIVFFIWGLRAAGAERVMSLLANHWASKGAEVLILPLADGQAKPFYPLDPAIAVRPLDLLGESSSVFEAIANNLRRLRVVRRAFKEARPDVVISFIDKANAIAVLASRGLGFPVVISERTDPSRRSLGRFWEALRRFAYPRADCVIFQSRAVLEWFPPIVRSKGRVIPNPVPPPPASAAIPSERAPGLRLVAIGRLFPVKGFDLLLRAFAQAAPRIPDGRLEVWGEGPERASLERLARELGLSGSARFMGITDRPFDVLRNADVFVMPSRAEGFPNALVEAMACGLPVISSDFGGAAREILRDGVDGLLVPREDPSSLAEAMVRLSEDPELRGRLSGRAVEVVERFSHDRVMGLWEDAIRDAMNRDSAGAAQGSHP